MEARAMESLKIAYKWRPKLWDHVKLHTNRGQSYGIIQNCIQMEAKAMESRKISDKWRARLWNHVKLYTNEGQSNGIT